MRVFFAVVASLSVAVAACSAGTEDSTLRRSPSAPSRAQAPTGGDEAEDRAPPASPASTADGSAPAPAPLPEGGAGMPAPTPPAPGSCGAPKCFGLAGVGGCKATDSTGALVSMACRDGACVCLVGIHTTASFPGDVDSADDARQLFAASCTCT